MVHEFNSAVIKAALEKALPEIGEALYAPLERPNRLQGTVALFDADGTLTLDSAQAIANLGWNSTVYPSLMHHLYKTGEAVFTSNYGEPGVGGDIIMLNFKSILACPVRVREQVVGAIYLQQRVQPATVLNENTLAYVRAIVEAVERGLSA